MKGNIHSILILLATIVAAVLLVAWSWGIMDTPKNEEGEVLMKHEWSAHGTEANPEFYETNLTFDVASDVGRLRITYVVEFPSDLTIGIPGSSESPSPEVRLELLESDGTVVRSIVEYSSASEYEDVNVTVYGGWVMHIWVKGYGYEGETSFGTSVEFFDSVKVTVLAI